MIARTHIAITLFFVLFFFSSEPNFLLFLFIALLATIIPDIDTRFSKIGKHFRIFNFFIKHRGFIHSFTFLILLSFLLFAFANQIWLPFFIGYASHLLIDSFTIQGITPLYPLGWKIRGKLKTNGLIETFAFVIFSFIDLFLILTKIFNFF